MLQSQYDELSKHFTITNITKGPDIDALVKTKFKNDEYYKEFTQLKFGRLSYFGVPSQPNININVSIFNTFNEIDKMECIPDKYIKFALLYNDKYILHEKYDLLVYPKGEHVYKAMNNYISVEEDVEYMTKEPRPIWYGSAYGAYQTLKRRWGGINSYVGTRDLKIIIINCENVKKILSLLTEDEYYFRNEQHSSEYAKNLLRMISCSDKGLVDQARIFSKTHGYGNDLWIAKNITKNQQMPCNMKIDNSSYNGIIKRKGKYNYDFAYMMRMLFLNVYDGYILLQNYNPYNLFSGTSSEELVLFDSKNILKRDISDPLDWYSYVNYLKIKPIKNFKVAKLADDEIINANFRLLHFYRKYKYNCKRNLKIKKKCDKFFQHNNNISVFYLNCNNFVGVNIQDSPTKNLEATKKLIRLFLPHIVVLQNAHKMQDELQNIYDVKIHKSFVILFKKENEILKDFVQNKIYYFSMKNKIYLKNIRKHNAISYTEFRKIADTNYQAYVNLFEDAKDNYDILIGSIEADTKSRFVEYLSENGFRHNKLPNNIFGRVNDYIFAKNYVLLRTLRFNRSYFLPVVSIVTL